MYSCLLLTSVPLKTFIIAPFEQVKAGKCQLNKWPKLLTLPKERPTRYLRNTKLRKMANSLYLIPGFFFQRFWGRLEQPKAAPMLSFEGKSEFFAHFLSFFTDFN